MASTLTKIAYTIKCKIVFIIVALLYLIPVYFDLNPSTDSYLFVKGLPIPIGVWGLIILIILGIGLSVVHGMTCLHEKTVFRCLNACSPDDEGIGLNFPPSMSSENKQKYIDGLKSVKQGFFTHHPFSEFSRKLAEINKQVLYHN